MDKIFFQTLTYVHVSLLQAEIQIKRSSTSVTSAAVERSTARHHTLELIFAGTQENVLSSAVGLFAANDSLAQTSCSATREHTRVCWIHLGTERYACLNLFDNLFKCPGVVHVHTVGQLNKTEPLVLVTSIFSSMNALGKKADVSFVKNVCKLPVSV